MKNKFLRSSALVLLLFALPIETACASSTGGQAGAIGVAPYSINPNGAQPSANSQPVVQALDQAVSSANISLPVSVTTNTTQQLVALSGSTIIYITAWDIISRGTGDYQLVAGTGTNCATGQHALTGDYNFIAQTGMNKGNGQATVLKAAAGEAVCYKTGTASILMDGSLTYQQR